MAYTQAQLPAQFVALAALTSDQYTDLIGGVGTFIGPQVGNWAFACACSHVLELTLRGTFGGGTGPVSSISGLDTSVSWASPPMGSTVLAWWQSTTWGQGYLASRQTAPRQLLMVAT
mgnify:CR=1 FL=1